MKNKVKILTLIIGCVSFLHMSGAVTTDSANRWLRGKIAPGAPRWDLPWGSYFNVVQDCVYLCAFDDCTLRCVGFEDKEVNTCSNTLDIKACKNRTWGGKFFSCGDCPSSSYEL